MQRILVAIDGSEPAWKALDVAAELARALGARVDLLHVVRPEPPPAGIAAYAEAERIPLEEEIARWRSERLEGDEIAREAAERLRTKGVRAVETIVEEGSPAPAILATAERLGADLVVVGSRGRTGLLATLLGSVSKRVAEEAPCSVLVVR
ncbi:MAG: universal stress protein [Geminicoccaceae bacterium]|nr:MAG: universal stress protein [Geminicoccaceae bacterium]